ncbi:hydroxymethylglutaryl-CoA synthase family protein [Streptomyces sp. 7-21]|jgi:polyketide biosynthesis 3-hydroxy-3-methylglutaryl-CoA synthase-like enzyme PksG|uniref:hydroxymethylglutaryl-CoA synthase family protein n=1 Tax=Streptomyces sp. 7-21 TaxID=2802283 RepID=UPI00191E034C|nr:hydroxymethylglutaryl-CoA synthase family protein [Streptomyces sp. 7-21]MBL1065923.1 hydroxymethylglutaryl-CoA synthase family protein [Streptomyces sp. 7-21]
MERRQAGIEAINFYGGSAYIDVTTLARYRQLDNERFENLLMREKSVALPFEDPVSFAVNAAKPVTDAMPPEDRDRIEMLITCTESGIDFGKSLSTYVHDYLGLSRRCRLFEVKNACFSGTAGFQSAVNFILSQVSPGAKALVVTTDMAKFKAADGGEALSEDWSFAEPSGGAGAVAMLISDTPHVYSVDIGANGQHGYEVMDTCRPIPDSEAGNADLSLMSYLDCCEAAYRDYERRVADVDYGTTFDYLSFHTPFGGMVKGAHRTMMRRMCKARGQAIEDDFQRRVMPGLTYCQRVGNIMGGSVFLNILSTIWHGDFADPKRLGVFSYGSGCCSEFYSGVVTREGQERVRAMNIDAVLDNRYELSVEEYLLLMKENDVTAFGTRNVEPRLDVIPEVLESIKGSGRLVLSRINEFHREYTWI